MGILIQRIRDGCGQGGVPMYEAVQAVYPRKVDYYTDVEYRDLK